MIGEAARNGSDRIAFAKNCERFTRNTQKRVDLTQKARMLGRPLRVDEGDGYGGGDGHLGGTANDACKEGASNHVWHSRRCRGPCLEELPFDRAAATQKQILCFWSDSFSLKFRQVNPNYQ